MDAVQFLDVAKQFGSQWAIRNLTFTVKTGEFLVIVGPSGCGKSSVFE
nr:ATP-binding cassette domain-containing protein [Ferroacidibacillus organovorans]